MGSGCGTRRMCYGQGVLRSGCATVRAGSCPHLLLSTTPTVSTSAGAGVLKTQCPNRSICDYPELLVSNVINVPASSLLSLIIPLFSSHHLTLFNFLIRTYTYSI